MALLIGWASCRADEGMWIPMLLKKYNIEDMQKQGFKLTAEDIYDINQASLKDVATLAVTFYVLLFGLSLFVVRLCLAGGVSTPGSWYLWGNLVALAVFPTAISFLCTTSAIQCIGSTPTAILGALEPLTAIAIGILVFGESLTVREGIGLALIIAAVTFVIAGGSVTQHLVRFRKLFPRLGRRR